MSPRDNYPPTGVIRKYPTYRDRSLGTVDGWILGKEADDGAEGLWRVHDDLYDLTTFIAKHPGGRDWIELTRGTDITEAFEIHHLSDGPEKLLQKFHMRKAEAPRNSMITFKEDGFYKTLKRKIRALSPESGPALKTKLLTDFFAFSTIAFAIMGATWNQGWCLLSGLFLHMLIVASHNFFHMKDNWRMYYFNFSLMSYRDWRVSHVLSHHIFPNTILDLEISMWEPIFKYLPDPKKTLLARFIPWIISPIMFVTMFHFVIIRRITEVVTGKKLRFRHDELFYFVIPFAVWLFSGAGVWTTFLTWNFVVATGSAIFGVVGLTAAHHHPDIYHEGDAFSADKDFAILQLAAVRDRIEVSGSFFLVMISFGDHALHHLFPTIDHHRLPQFYPAFLQTCKQFGIDYTLLSCADLFTGMYKQLARNYRNAKLVIMKNK